MRYIPIAFHFLAFGPRRYEYILLCLALLVGLFSQGTLAATEVSAKVDRNQVGMYQTFNLIIIKEGSAGGAKPNLQPLQKDFEVLGTTASSQMKIVNGNMSQQTEWRGILSPKK